MITITISIMNLHDINHYINQYHNYAMDRITLAINKENIIVKQLITATIAENTLHKTGLFKGCVTFT